MWPKGAAQGLQLCRGPTGRGEGGESRQRGRARRPWGPQEKEWKMPAPRCTHLLHSQVPVGIPPPGLSGLSYLKRPGGQFSILGTTAGSMSFFEWLVTETFFQSNRVL